MNNREAIKIIGAIKEECVSMFLENSKVREACDLAISALEKHVDYCYLNKRRKQFESFSDNLAKHVSMTDKAEEES